MRAGVALTYGWTTMVPCVNELHVSLVIHPPCMIAIAAEEFGVHECRQQEMSADKKVVFTGPSIVSTRHFPTAVGRKIDSR